MASQLSKEDQATQRLASRQAARESRLLGDGLARLRAGRAPTKTQLPFVQQWLAGHDNEVKALKADAQAARIDRDILDGHYRRLIATSNSVFDVLREFGIRLYSKTDDNHGWEGEIDEIKGGQEGYASFADALRAALQWRIALVEIR